VTLSPKATTRRGSLLAERVLVFGTLGDIPEGPVAPDLDLSVPHEEIVRGRQFSDAPERRPGTRNEAVAQVVVEGFPIRLRNQPRVLEDGLGPRHPEHPNPSRMLRNA
jgi:hypothetical protein